MIKMMATARRRPGMTHAEYLAYNVDVHGTKTRDRPVGIRRYVQSHVLDAGFGRTGDSQYAVEFGRDGVSELYFDDIDEITRTFTDPVVLVDALKDGPNYADVVTTISMFARETELAVLHPGGGKLKIFHFLRRKMDIAEADFAGQWRIAHDRAVAISGCGVHLRKVIWSEPSAEGKPFVEAMGSSTEIHGVASFWFDREDSGATLFRTYLDALEMLPDSPIDHSSSFFLLTRELVLFDHG